MSAACPQGLLPQPLSLCQPCTSLLAIVMATLSSLSERKEGQILLAKGSMLDATILVWNLTYCLCLALTPQELNIVMPETSCIL